MADTDAPRRISVVVPAYQRSTFLRGAVESVVTSEPPPDGIEIVVIKNFEYPDIDAFLLTKGVRIIDFGSRNYGSTLARAIRSTRGEVVAFLEDDDRFTDTKIARLESVFASFPSVVFYHNDYSEIDEAGVPRPASAERRAIDARMKDRGVERYTPADQEARFDRLCDTLPMAHMSCMAFRRSALEPLLVTLERVPIGADFFLFFGALASRGDIVIDPAKLTLYRRHPGNSSRALSFDPAWYRELVEGSSAMVRETRSVLRTVDSPALHGHLEDEIAAHALYVALSKAVPDRHEVAAGIAGMLRRPGSLRGIERRRLLGKAWGFLGLPRSAGRIFRPAEGLS